MKKSKKLNRVSLKKINGGIGSCNENCPDGPYGPNEQKSCGEYFGLPECCKKRVLVSYECFEPF
ncbi:hypothetical protein [Chryseobacterium sp. JK1]|uniref:hypothetical protein n=1 Tax=Chryseobacterium sp. JK1 TaxID=874294 RepID=UPI003D6914E6